MSYFHRNRPISNNNCLLRQWLCMDREELSNLHRRPSINASYHVLVHLAKRFQRRRFFFNRPIRNKNCLWWPCLLMDRNKMCNIKRGSSIVWHRCFLLSFSSFGWGVSEEKIKMWKANGWRRQAMAKAHIPVLDITSSFFPHSYSVEGFGATILLLILAELRLFFLFVFYKWQESTLESVRSDNRWSYFPM